MCFYQVTGNWEIFRLNLRRERWRRFSGGSSPDSQYRLEVGVVRRAPRPRWKAVLWILLRVLWELKAAAEYKGRPHSHFEWMSWWWRRMSKKRFAPKLVRTSFLRICRCDCQDCFHMSLLSKMKLKYVTVVERGMMIELMWSRMFLVLVGDLQKCMARTFIGVKLMTGTNEPVF